MLLDPDDGLLISLAKGLQARQWRCAVHLLWTLVCLSLSLTACGRALAPPADRGADTMRLGATYDIEADSKEAPVYNVTDLIDDLRALGLTVVPTERPADHGFAIEGIRMFVEDTPVYVYEFAEATAAQAAAAGVSTDKYSMTITRTKGEITYVQHSDWLETPHVYLKGRVIVVTGDDPLVVDALDTLLGPSLNRLSVSIGRHFVHYPMANRKRKCWILPSRSRRTCGARDSGLLPQQRTHLSASWALRMAI